MTTRRGLRQLFTRQKLALPCAFVDDKVLRGLVLADAWRRGWRNGAHDLAVHGALFVEVARSIRDANNEVVGLNFVRWMTSMYEVDTLKDADYDLIVKFFNRYTQVFRSIPASVYYEAHSRLLAKP